MTLTVMRTSAAQRQRTKAEEGLRLKAYKDTQDPPVWTIGWGHAATNPAPVRGTLKGEPYIGPPKLGVEITLQEAERLFDEDAEETERVISSGIRDGLDLSQGQMDALFDFVHHYGADKFLGSTLLQKVNFNPNNLEAVLPEFARWNIVAGKRDEAIYRRSCRRACVYAGAPIPDLLWKSARNGFPWALHPHGEINHDITPGVFELVVMGKEQGKTPTPQKPKPAPVSPPASAGAEATLDLTEQAAPDTNPVAGADPSVAAGSPPTRSASAATPPSPLQEDRPADVPPATAGEPVRESGPTGRAGAGGGVPRLPPAIPKAPSMRPEPKNPMRSQTMWGGLLTALAPQLDQIGNILMAKSAVFGPPGLALGIVLIILGRIGATQPLSTSAPIRSQS